MKMTAKISAFFLCCFLFVYITDAANRVVVTKEVAKVMTLPYGDARSLGFVKKNEQFSIITQKGEWFNIEYKNSVGWIFKGNISVVSASVATPPAVTKPASVVVNTPKGQAPQQKNEPVDLPPATIDANGNDASGFVSLKTTMNHTITDTSIKYFEITESSTSILATVSPDAQVLGVARHGDCFLVLYAGQAWCKVKYNSVNGWVDRRVGRIVDAPTLTKKIPQLILFIVGGIGGLAIIVFFIVFLSMLLKKKNVKRIIVKKDMLLISSNDKEIQYSLTNTTTTVSKCFSEIGFKVSFARDIDHAKNLLLHYLPDVIVVDYQLDPNIIRETETVLISNKMFSANMLVIFFNVPDAVAQIHNLKIPHVYFLSVAFADRDIFKLVTPLILAGADNATKSIRNSVEASALGGEIGDGNLIEVMQFIEIGRKTGCLYIIQQDKPFGLIYFEQGRLTYASCKDVQGSEAVFEILKQKNGHFHFVLDKTTTNKNVKMSTLEILMEWTKAEDEAHRN